MKKVERAEKLENISKFGFLFVGYKNKLYYWEFIIYIRKIMSVLVYVAFFQT